jgi:hypothetical protein
MGVAEDIDPELDDREGPSAGPPQPGEPQLTCTTETQHFLLSTCFALTHRYTTLKVCHPHCVVIKYIVVASGSQ